MKRRFFTLDVFTARKFAGNPLAVVLDAEGLDTEAMQAIAREFNLSETVFVLPASDPAHKADIRIFTPSHELPFAGHPTVGTAVLLGLLDGMRAGQIFTLGEKVGPVTCRVTSMEADTGAVDFDLPRLPTSWGASSDSETIALAFGLTIADLGFDAHIPSRFSGGVPYDLIPVGSLDTLARLTLNSEHYWRAFGDSDFPSAFIYTRQTNGFRGRMFFPTSGLIEDPATGSAVAAFAGAILRFDEPADGRHDLVIEQGYEMGRPSQIRLGLEVRDGALVSATIGGAAIIVSEGHLHA